MGIFVFGGILELATLTTAEVMDSRDIAKLTGKEHGHVCRDISKMFEEMEIDQSSFGSVYRAGNGEDRKCYLLPKRECLILASGYNVKLRAAIIDRWTELESSKPKLTILDYARELIASHEREAATLAEKKDLLVELDRSKEYASIKRMEKLWKRKFAWQKLKAQSTEAGIEIKQVFDQNYGNVNAYREDVWMEVYGIAVTKEKN